MPFDSDHLDELKRILYELIPASGESKGNTALRSEFLPKARSLLSLDLDENDYWTVRDKLLDDGKVETGRGRGGSVRRVPETAETPSTAPVGSKYERESDLYEPFHSTIRSFYVKNYRIRHFVSEITATQGRRDTGGKWTRPDVTLVAVRTYPFIPGKTLDVVTFEIKPVWAYGIEGVFETASHSIFANKSYLALHAPEEVPSSEQDRLERECRRFGVGLMTFVDPKVGDTYEIIVEAQHLTPDPHDVSTFISTQLSEQQKADLHELIR